MLTLIRTNSDNANFKALVQLLDAELAIRDGADHAFYAQFNKTDKIRYVVVAFVDGFPTGCGAIKEFETDVMEIKRMFVVPAGRGKGIASHILSELEKWAVELSFVKCILETGYNQPEAIALYHKCGYNIIPNYAQYIGIESSLCFEKIIQP